MKALKLQAFHELGSYDGLGLSKSPRVLGSRFRVPQGEIIALNYHSEMALPVFLSCNLQTLGRAAVEHTVISRLTSKKTLFDSCELTIELFPLE